MQRFELQEGAIVSHREEKDGAQMRLIYASRMGLRHTPMTFLGHLGASRALADYDMTRALFHD